MAMAMEPTVRIKSDGCAAMRLMSARKVCLLACSIAGLVPLQLLAADWKVTPRVSGSETWSDNINLSTSGAKEHDFATQVTPGIGVRARGNRLSLNFDYQAGLVHYARATKSRELQNRLQANGTADVVKNLFTVDVRSTISQRNQSAGAVQSTDAVSIDSNRGQAVTFGISPTLHWRFGRFASSRLTYSRDEVNNSGALSTSLDSLSLSVSSGREFATLPWTISASSRREDNSTGTQSTFRQANATVRYSFSRRYSVRVLGGYSDNDLVAGTSGGRSVDWRVTGIWSPTPRTRVELGYGQQPFGRSFSLNASHTMRRAVFTAAYNESITTTSFQQSQATLFALEDDFGNEILNPGEQVVGIATNEATLGDETIVSRVFSFGMSVRGRRTSGGLNLTNSRRAYQRNTEDDVVSTISTNVSHKLSRHTTATAGATVQLSDPSGVNDESTQIGLNVGISHTLSQDVTTRVNYGHQRVSSDAPSSSYTENRLTANVSVRF
jgi:uncharacterized protein (PEP-CTERM system associated)